MAGALFTRIVDDEDESALLKRDLAKFVTSAGLTGDANAMFDHADRNDDKSLSRPEFAAALFSDHPGWRSLRDASDSVRAARRRRS